jgi:hypothetical protein
VNQHPAPTARYGFLMVRSGGLPTDVPDAASSNSSTRKPVAFRGPSQAVRIIAKAPREDHTNDSSPEQWRRGNSSDCREPSEDSCTSSGHRIVPLRVSRCIADLLHYALPLKTSAPCCSRLGRSVRPKNRASAGISGSEPALTTTAEEELAEFINDLDLERLAGSIRLRSAELTLGASQSSAHITGVIVHRRVTIHE